MVAKTTFIVIDGAVDAPDTLGKLLGPERFQQLREARGNEHDGQRLPAQIASVEREEIDLDVKYRPVDRVGGDYCHVHFPGERECLLTVCDVSGHGVASVAPGSE